MTIVVVQGVPLACVRQYDWHLLSACPRPTAIENLRQDLLIWFPPRMHYAHHSFGIIDVDYKLCAHLDERLNMLKLDKLVVNLLKYRRFYLILYRSNTMKQKVTGRNYCYFKRD